ncbi:MAG: NifB/NifX family molybdenum-iron cluster-binding protein [Promethearchaeota archaeon]
MKIVISATGRDIESNIDATFGRCSFFLVLDTKTKDVKALINTTKDIPDKIGVTAGEIVANQGIDAVITADIGPKAFEAFKKYGIKIYQGEGKINDVVHQLEEGMLSEITKPTGPMYMGLKKNENSSSIR